MSLLLLFVASESLFGWPSERGTTTITIAHITFSLAFVAVLVQARLSTFDRSLEEAALDLGAPPWKVYFVITLPLIAPALISGWLLAFTMSLDDLVISSFVSGPGSSTLPMVVFSMVRRGLSPEINALATLFIGAIGIGIIASVSDCAQRLRDAALSRQIRSRSAKYSIPATMPGQRSQRPPGNGRVGIAANASKRDESPCSISAISCPARCASPTPCPE